MPTSIVASNRHIPGTPRTAEVQATHEIVVNLKAARQTAGISLAQASRALGISETSVKSLERSASPQLGSIARYAAMCGIENPLELLTATDVAGADAELVAEAV